MTNLKYLIFFILSVFLISCTTTEKIKTIDWNGNTITLSIINGGATTAYLYKIEFKRKWIFGRDRLIFWSYSTPILNDISVENDKLTIHCFASENQTNNIIIDLKNISEFIDRPVKYRRSILEKTNKYYNEPNFIKRDRQQAKKYGLTK